MKDASTNVTIETVDVSTSSIEISDVSASSIDTSDASSIETQNESASSSVVYGDSDIQGEKRLYVKPYSSMKLFASYHLMKKMR